MDLGSPKIFFPWIRERRPNTDSYSIFVYSYFHIYIGQYTLGLLTYLNAICKGRNCMFQCCSIYLIYFSILTHFLPNKFVCNINAWCTYSLIHKMKQTHRGVPVTDFYMMTRNNFSESLESAATNSVILSMLNFSPQEFLIHKKYDFLA